MNKTILDTLREAFTPNVESMLDKGEVVLGTSRASQKRSAAACSTSCTVCGHSVTFMKGRSGAPLCAACLTLSAKMPCHSDPGKDEKKRGLSPCNPKGGGMGLLITQDATGGGRCHFFVKEEKFDLVFLDTVPHTRIPLANFDRVVIASVEAAMSLEDGTHYWWGFVQENDIYPTLDMLRMAPWDLAQDTMRFRGGVGTPPCADTRASWRAIAAVKKHPEYVRMLKSVKRIVEREKEEVQETKLAALPWDECPECQTFLCDINEHAMLAFF